MTRTRKTSTRQAKKQPAKKQPTKKTTKASSRRSTSARSQKVAGNVNAKITSRGKKQVSEKKAIPPPPPKPEPPKPQVEETLSIKLDQSVAILVDGNNIEMSLHTVARKKGAMINFDKLVPALVGNRALSRLIYFREGKSISTKLAERLQKMFHGSVVPCYKSADIPLSIKAVQVASKVDTIIILSGDADYIELVRHLKHDGIRVEIAAFPETTADILRNESDYFFPITVDYSFELK